MPEEPDFTEVVTIISKIVQHWRANSAFDENDQEDCYAEVATQLWRAGWLRDEPLDVETDLSETLEA